MTLSPTGAVAAGASWRVDGGAWQPNGGMVWNLSNGNHTASFMPVKGWRAPDDQIINVGTNFITSAAASYFALPGGPSQPAFQVLHTFSGGDGSQPWSPLILCGNTLYGTTTGGGSSGQGVTFAVNTDGTAFTNLYSFANGGGCYAGLTQFGDILYGTTLGSVFKINLDGTGFANICSSNIDQSYASVLVAGNTLYGTTRLGGAHNVGAVFAVNTDGTGFTNLYSFTGYLDGQQPYSGLALAGATLYGFTFEGYPAGSPFAIQTNGAGFTNFPDNGYFRGNAILSSNILYTTGNYGVFKINTDGTGFAALGGSDCWGGVILAGHTLYGTREQGGSSASQNNYGYGAVFAIRTDGSGYTNLYNFTSGSDGGMPEASLLLSETTLFGTAPIGGTNGNGVVYMLTFPPPQLTVQPAGTNVILSWLDGVSGAGYDLFAVQTATNLTPPVIWNTLPTAPVSVNGWNTVTNPASATPIFYRLSQ